MISEFYKDKSIFLTGCTGFVGKVVLEKFMHSLPEFKKIYVMVRAKRGFSAKERVQKEIFASPCFDGIRSRPDFEHMVNNKIHPIIGDICKERLAMSEEDRALLVRELDVVINMAASVDFVERLCDAL